MYSIYTSEGIVLKSSPLGEADRLYVILTKDFGLIEAEAKGVRKEESKLRYSLSEFSLSDVSFVRGRNRWRISSAVCRRNFFHDLGGRTDLSRMLWRSAALLRRLVQGEEKNDFLYESFKNAAIFCADYKPSGKLQRNTEYLIALRIMHSLGYLREDPEWHLFTSASTFTPSMIESMDGMQKDLIERINESIRESHL